jgi:hypothetical protein
MQIALSRLNWGRAWPLALAVSLGVLAGFVGGWNLSVAVIVLMAVLLNSPKLAFLAAWGFGAATAWIAEGRCEAAGRFLIDHTGVGGLVSGPVGHPILAMLGWDQPIILGGLAIGLFVGLTAGVGAVWIAPREKEQPVRRRGANAWFRAVAWRLAVVAVWGMGVSWLLPKYVEGRLLDQLAVLNGAEVNADRVDVSLGTGAFSIDDLRAADPASPDHDRLRVARASGTLDVAALMRGSLAAREVELLGIDTGVRRPATAWVAGEAQGSPIQPHALADADTRETEDGQLSASLEEVLVDGSEAAKHFERWAGLLEWIEACCRCGQATDGSESRSSGRPMIAVEQLRVTDLDGAWALGPRAALEVRNLSSVPTEPVEVVLVVPQWSAEAAAVLHMNEEEGGHEMAFRLFDVPLGRVIDGSALGQGTAVAGRVNLSGEGSLKKGQLGLSVVIEGRGISLPPAECSRLSGLAPATIAAVCGNPTVRLELGLVGPVASPRWEIHPDDLAAQVRNQAPSVETLAAAAPPPFEPVTTESAPALNSSELAFSSAATTDQTTQPASEPMPELLPRVSTGGGEGADYDGSGPSRTDNRFVAEGPAQAWPSTDAGPSGEEAPPPTFPDAIPAEPESVPLPQPRSTGTERMRELAEQFRREREAQQSPHPLPPSSSNEGPEGAFEVVNGAAMGRGGASEAPAGGWDAGPYAQGSSPAGFQSPLRRDPAAGMARSANPIRQATPMASGPSGLRGMYQQGPEYLPSAESLPFEEYTYEEPKPRKSFWNLFRRSAPGGQPAPEAEADPFNPGLETARSSDQPERSAGAGWFKSLFR